MRTRLVAPLVLAVVALFAAPASGVPEATRPLATAQPCPAALGPGWRCAVVSVPRDRSGRVPGRVALAVALRHRPGPPRPAVVALGGGPGSAALPSARRFARRLAPLLARRDLLVLDQRGTGASGPIACPAVDRAVAWSPATVRDCADRLGPARAFYRTADSVADVDDVRRALRIPRLTVYGVSYGTKVAADYARAHPRRMDRLVLDSPIVEDTDPFYRRSAAGAARVLRNQCVEGYCDPGADPVADLGALVARMRRGALPALPAVAEGPLLDVVVDGGDGLHRLPHALHLAVAGKPAALAALLPRTVPDARDPAWLQRSFSPTVYLVTSCEDGDFPWAAADALADRLAAAGAALDRLGDAAFAPFDRYAGEQYGEARMCASWPEAARQPAPGPLPDVPALLLVGGDDDLAPLEGAREIAGELPRARVVVLPGGGHGELHASGRGQAALRAFAAGR